MNRSKRDFNVLVNQTNYRNFKNIGIKLIHVLKVEWHWICWQAFALLWLFFIWNELEPRTAKVILWKFNNNNNNNNNNIHIPFSLKQKNSQAMNDEDGIVHFGFCAWYVPHSISKSCASKWRNTVSSNGSRKNHYCRRVSRGERTKYI